MSDRTWLRQVTLARHTEGNSSKEDVFWIREEFARADKRLVDEDGIVWTVKEVYGRSAVDDLDKRMAVWRRWRDVLEK